MIVLAKKAGFCFGVKRAVDMVLENSKTNKICTLGPIIHNDSVVSDFEKRGVRVIENVSECKEDETLVIRTHGVPKAVEDEIIKRGIKYIDATCPFVKKIHNLVREYFEKGYKIVIIGDENHPEVIGINGWCENSAVVIDSICDAQKISDKISDEKVLLVAQTTFNREIWEKIIEIFKKACQTIEVFDTICIATNERQHEAAIISKKSDVMIVIGGAKSSNTKKLFDICKQNAKKTFLIEDASFLTKEMLIGENIGVTAGASTPANIIKEVICKMEQIKNTNPDEQSFAELFEDSLVTLNTGDKVKGIVTKITEADVCVDLGYKADGYITLDQLTDDPGKKPSDIVSIGDEIEVFVIRVSDVEGTVMLSKKRIDSMKSFEAIASAFEEDRVLDGLVIDVVRGGVVVLTEGVRVFVPASQASERFTQDLNALKGQKVPLKLIDYNPERRKVVGSIKKVLVQQRNEKVSEFWAGVENNKQYSGVVKSLTNFGAFVDIGGVDGLVHISELSWGRIKHPSEVVKVGDCINVYIIDANKETGKISLGYKDPNGNPWEIAKNKFSVGDIVECKVVRLVPFGAFVELMDNLDGLIHISQIAQKRINKPSDVLKIGDVVTAKIVEADFEAKKISLSITALEEPKAEEAAPAEAIIEEAPEAEAVLTEETIE